MPRISTHAGLCQWAIVLLATGAAGPVTADRSLRGENPEPAGRPALPAEETRFDAAVFRAALQKRGLKTLLDLHVRAYPPTDALARLMMARDMKLAEFGDPLSPRERRLAAVAEANRILDDIITGFPDHPSRFAWRFELARSTLHDETEWMLAPLLHREIPPRDPEGVAARTTAALRRVDELLGAVTAEYARLDALPLEEFEVIEQSGRVDELDRLQPRGQYLRLWALFFDAIRRPERDAVRAASLHAILDALRQNPEFVETPHAESRVQAPALLLAGMTQRRLHHAAKARELLDRAVHVAEAVTDAKERSRVKWILTVGRLERIRIDRDEGKFPQAAAATASLARQLSDDRGDGFAERLSVAILLRSVERAWAEEAHKTGDIEAWANHKRLAWQGLAALLEAFPDRSDEVLLAVFDVMGGGAVAGSDPLDQAALMCGVLSESSPSVGHEDAAARRAMDIGDALLGGPAADLGPLEPIVRFKLGVAAYRLDRKEDAARRFLELSAKHPASPLAPRAAAYAVQLSHELRRQGPQEVSSSAEDLFRRAVEWLVTRFPESEDAAYWRFFHAVELFDAGRFDEAAGQFGMVGSDHEFHLDAMQRRIIATASALRLQAQGHAGISHEAVRIAGVLTTRQKEYERAVREAGRGGEAAIEESADSLVAVAECQLLSTVESPRTALELLEPFEDRHPGRRDLWGRVWHARLLAYERIGRLDEAMRAVPNYIAADPAGAQATLTWLYEVLAAEADALSDNHPSAAKIKAEAALALAERVASLSTFSPTPDDAGATRRPLMLLGEANLRAGRFERSRELFAEAVAGSAENVQSMDDARVIEGLAESLYRLGEVAAALPHFNRLAVRLPPEEPIRWRSLLRDLQCRTMLGEPPEHVLKVIEQQAFLYPDLGGPRLASHFDRLRAENVRRHDASLDRGESPAP